MIGGGGLARVARLSQQVFNLFFGLVVLPIYALNLNLKIQIILID